MQSDNNTNYSDPAELLAVVDADDVETGAERRDVIHRDGLLHRAIHLFVFRSDGRLLLQQRSEKKDMYPLHWECVGGHLSPGERYDDCVIREAREELGLRIAKVKKLTKLAASARTDWEFITVYITITDEPIFPDSAEVIATEWLLPDQWKQEIRAAKRPFSPTLLHTFESCPEILNRGISC